jgi:hypothetical protein
LKCSHAFNLLDARNAISVTERTGYISRIRALASRCCEAFVNMRASMGHPLVGKFEDRGFHNTDGFRNTIEDLPNASAKGGNAQ